MNSPTIDNHEPIHRILVATDFSSGAKTALLCAIEVAKLHGSSIQLVHALDAPCSSQKQLEPQVRRNLTMLEGHVKDAGVESCSMSRPGKPWLVVAALERETRPDLIVVGTRGHSPWLKPHLGSKADRIIRTAQCPVLAVHPDDVGSLFSLDHVVVAIDFSEESILAVHAVIRLLGRSPSAAKLVLVHAFHIPTEYTLAEAGALAAIDLTESEAEVDTRLQAIAASVRSDRIEVECRARYGYPVSVIEDEAEVNKADLIAVGTLGRSGLQHLFLGSVAERVIHHARCPVLSVRHPERAALPAPTEMADSVRD